MGNRIRQLREERKMKQVDLAAALGVRQNTLSTWETGRYEPDNDMLKRIADYFSVSVDYVLGESPIKEIPTTQIDMMRIIRLMRTVEEMDTEQFDDALNYANNILNRLPTSKPESARIPVLGAVPAGIPLEAIEDVVDWEEIPQSMLSGGKEFFALQVQGNSMYPEYLPGDTVIVRKSPVCNSGDVCIVYVNGYDATLKQVKLLPDGCITLLPRNPEYPPRTYTPEEIENLPVSIAGVVVELRRKVNK